MTQTWKTLSAADRVAAERVFDAAAAVDNFREWSEAAQERPRRIGFSDLYAYATEPDLAMDEALHQALARDVRLSSDLDSLLKQIALYRFPRVAAASSGAVELREGDGFRIRLRPSRAAPGQTYVMIDLTKRMQKAPRTLFVRDSAHQFGKYPLPEAQDDVIQIVSDDESELIKALREAGTEVLLK